MDVNCPRLGHAQHSILSVYCDIDSPSGKKQPHHTQKEEFSRGSKVALPGKRR